MADLKSCRILVTPTSYAKTDPRLRIGLESLVGEVIYNTLGRPLTSEEVKSMLPGCDGYIAGVDTIDRNALEGADRLKVIARYGVGVDNIDLEAAKEKGIIVTNTPGANAVSVAELTVGLMIALARRVIEAVSATRAGEWPRLMGTSLEGKEIGLLGLGAVGKQVARRLQGFDCTIIAHDPVPDLEFAQKYGVEILPQADVVRRADFLSLHLPLLPETRGMVNAEFIAQMKRGAFLINTARGELVDEQALLEALQSGHLRGAALDTFVKQPPDPDNPLLALPQVIATPLMGAHADSATNAMGWAALRACLAVLSGEEPAHRVI